MYCSPESAVALFVLGACIGSFFNVLIYRMPKGESVVSPGSRCPSCGTPIKWYHNIPVVSYLFLKGRCAYCGAKISPRYVLVEVLTAFALLALCAKFGLSKKLVWATLFLLPLIPAAFIDLDHYILPDTFTLGTLVWGVLSSFLGLSPVNPQDALIGLLLCGGFFLLVAVLSRGGMGLGDVKLAASFGANFGWKVGATALFVSVFMGASFGIALILLRKKGRKDKIPFGPFMILGAYICAFFGRELSRLYLGF